MSQKVGISIHVRMDNMVALSYLMKMGGTYFVNEQGDLGLPVLHHCHNSRIPPGSYECRSTLGVMTSEGLK